MKCDFDLSSLFTKFLAIFVKNSLNVFATSLGSSSMFPFAVISEISFDFALDDLFIISFIADQIFFELFLKVSKYEL